MAGLLVGRWMFRRKGFVKSTRLQLLSTAAETSTSATVDLPNNQSDDKLDPSVKRKFSAPIDKYNKFTKVPQAWVTGFDSLKETRLGVIDLHPDVFQVNPRLDILKDNVDWQEKYRSITYIKALTRAELPGSGRKPWPQKGLGKARHGSTRSPIWHQGGIVHGDRGPKTHFYMLPLALRIKGLQIALTVKHAQDDLVIVDDLNSLPEDSSTFLHELAEQRNWGYSVLFVDASHDGPRNLLLASAEIPSFNVIPYYGLNCYSMMKHDTLVLTLSALERIEERILFNLTAVKKPGLYKMKDYMELNTDEGAEQEDEPLDFPPSV